MTFKSEEFIFIDHINTLFSDIDTQGSVGIGDDCAITPISESEVIVTTCDMLTEGIHFLRDAISPFDLGYKSLAVNLSDVASMGAKPIGTFLSIAFPKNISKEWREEFMAGYYDLSRAFGVPLLGGDTVSSKDLITINVTATGRTLASNIKLRSAANVDQTIYVSGTLGDSATGLQMILRDIDDFHALKKEHCHPQPFIKEGMWLGGRNEVCAMTDISDGIASDLRHIMERSNIGAVITNIPISALCQEACAKYNISVNEVALSGGEDYRLLFTVKNESCEKFEIDYFEEFGYRPFNIGYTSSEKELYIKEQNNITPIKSYGYIHL